MVTACRIKSNGDVHYMTLELMTQSLKMDTSKHIRTFQKDKMSYKEILSAIVKRYSRGGFISSEEFDKKSDGFMCQYKETDWEYIKRLASWAGTIIYPEYKTEGEKLYIGIPKKDEVSINIEHYESGLDCGDEAILGTGRLYYKIVLRELYDIGQRVIFLGESLSVISRYSRLEYGEIVNEYVLMHGYGLVTNRLENQKIIGAVLFAKVKTVEDTLVTVKVEEDENEDSGEKLLKYATVYSSPDGGSWYCMPEVGDRVMLRFPDSSEKSVYVQNAVHVGREGGRSNPKIKFFKNKEGKEIRLSPDGVLITDNQGSKIELRDKEGIYISSQGMVAIEANTEVLIESNNSGVKLSSPMAIQINQDGTQIELSDRIMSQGSKIYLG